MPAPRYLGDDATTDVAGTTRDRRTRQQLASDQTNSAGSKWIYLAGQGHETKLHNAVHTAPAGHLSATSADAPLVPAPNSVGTQLAVVRPLWRSLALVLASGASWCSWPGLTSSGAPKRRGTTAEPTKRRTSDVRSPPRTAWPAAAQTRYAGRWGTYGLADELWAAAGGGKGSVRLRNGRCGCETPRVRPAGGATGSTASTSMGACEPGSAHAEIR